MTSPAGETSRERRHRQRARRRRRRRAVAIGGGFVLLVVLAVAAWVGFKGIAAVHQMRIARAAAEAIQADISNGSPIGSEVATFREASARANTDTHDAIWNGLGWLPPIKTVRGITSEAADIGQQVMPDLARVAPTVTPEKLRINGHTVNTAALSAAAPKLVRASSAMNRVAGELAKLPQGWFGPISRARNEFANQAADLAGSLTDVADLARVGPGMLGAKGPRTYFVGVENNAESRGTGGLIGGFVIVRAHNGSIKVVRHGTDADLRDPGHPVKDVPPGFDSVYGEFDARSDWRDSNLSPDFPAAAEIWAQLWRAQTGHRIDGAIAVDPAALAGLLEQTGPITDPVRGGTVTGADLVSLIESKEYAEFTPAQNKQRKDYLSKLSVAVIDKLLSGAGSPIGIVRSLAASAGTGDLQIFSETVRDEKVLEETPIAGAVPDTRTPFAALTVDNASGTKLDYYLSRQLSYTSDGCADNWRQTIITAALTNRAPRTGLPAYVLDQPELGPHAHEKVATNSLLVFIDATAGARLTRATLDGRTVQVSAGVADGGHVVFELPVMIPPGATRTITMFLSEPILPGNAGTKVQPLALPQTTSLDVGACS